MRNSVKAEDNKARKARIDNLTKKRPYIALEVEVSLLTSFASFV